MTPSLSSAQKLLVIAPHPDDDVITSAGIIHAAVARGDDVKVVYMTNGDLYGGKATGYLRQREAVDGVAQLGLAEPNLIFFGYPDGALDILYENYQTPKSVYKSVNGISETYGDRGLGNTDYHKYVFGKHAKYNAPNVVTDLQNILSTYQPGQIFVTAEEDIHLDHAYSYRFLQDALGKLAVTAPAYLPSTYKTLVHVEGERAPQSGWAEADPQALTPQPPNMNLLPALQWLNRVSVNVAEQLQAPDFFDNLKVKALYSHQSQGGTEPAGYLQSFVHKDEFFWVEQARGTNKPPHVEAGSDQAAVAGTTVTLSAAASTDPNGDPLQYFWRQASGPAVQIEGATTATPSFVAPDVPRDTVMRFELRVSDGTFVSVTDSLLVTTSPRDGVGSTNIAGLAAVTGSTENTATQQLAIKAIDGVVDGYPGDATKEWATTGQGVGAWLQLTWPNAMVIDEVILHDRPNASDQALAGRLIFGDGSTVPFSVLDNLGAATRISGFAPITADSLRIAFDQVAMTTASIGLAEVKVFGKAAPTGSPNIAALATLTASSQNAGTAQLAVKAVDGVADGYPGDFTKEWATTGEGSGAWLQLTWPSAKVIDQVTLFDRPNPNDHVLAASLRFGDGTIVPVSALNNDGAATTIRGFTPVTTDSLRITFDQVAATTANIGLAEVQVLGTDPQTLLV
jgi:LmbE family N-acetylglucosaminyl deacetylase